MINDLLYSIPEKIDTITLKLERQFVNKSLVDYLPWHLVNNGFTSYTNYILMPGLSLMRTEVCIKSGVSICYYYVSLQYEYIWPNLLFNKRCNKDLLLVVFETLLKLEHDGYIVLSGLCPVPDWAKKRWQNFSQEQLELACNYTKICRLSELDFAFDFKKNQIRCFNDCTSYDSTVYSKDHKKQKSQWICYERIKKEARKNQTSKTDLAKIKYPLRLEIRLSSLQQCQYLNLFNLRGTFFEVFYRFAPVIAKSWKSNAIGIVEKDQQHILFNHIQDFEGFKTPPKVSKELKKIR